MEEMYSSINPVSGPKGIKKVGMSRNSGHDYQSEKKKKPIEEKKLVSGHAHNKRGRVNLRPEGEHKERRGRVNLIVGRKLEGKKLNELNQFTMLKRQLKQKGVISECWKGGNPEGKKGRDHCFRKNCRGEGSVGIDPWNPTRQV